MSVTEVTATVVTPVVLEGRWVRLEPLTVEHAAALLRAASGPRETYGLTLVPGTLAEAAAVTAFGWWWADPVAAAAIGLGAIALGVRVAQSN